MWVAPCFMSLHDYSRTLFITTLVGHLFKMYAAQCTSSAQYSFGKCFSFNILLTMSVMVLFFLSTTPFCCSVYLAVNCLCMPFSLQKRRNYFEIYAPPLSILKTFICCPLCFSTRALKWQNFSNTSLLYFKKYTQVFLV